MNKPFVLIPKDEFGRVNQFGWLYGLQSAEFYESDDDLDVYKFGGGDELLAKDAAAMGGIFLSGEEVGAHLGKILA